MPVPDPNFREYCEVCCNPIEQCDCDLECHICGALYRDHDNDGLCTEEALKAKAFMDRELGNG